MDDASDNVLLQHFKPETGALNFLVHRVPASNHQSDYSIHYKMPGISFFLQAGCNVYQLN